MGVTKVTIIDSPEKMRARNKGYSIIIPQVRDYAAQVTRDHNRVGDRQFDGLRAHFSETQIVELTLRITLCTFFNKFNDVMMLEMEDEVAIFHHETAKPADHGADPSKGNEV